MRRSYYWVFAVALTLYFAAVDLPAYAQETASPSPSASPSSEPAVAPTGDQAASPAPSPSPSPSATPVYKSPFYSMDNDVYTRVPSVTGYYYFQSNPDGSAKVKQELRLAKTMWNDNAVMGIRLPYITKFPIAGNPYYSLGDIEGGYSYNVTSKTFNHSLEFRIALPTAQNGVDNTDTELKGFYVTKWKFNGWAVAYSNEYDQSIITPKGATYTSYYEGKLTLPDYAFKNLPGLNFSAFYNYRILVDSGGKFKDALGGTLFGNINDVAMSITDSWGLGGANGSLWRYKFEANLTARFPDI